MKTVKSIPFLILTCLIWPFTICGSFAALPVTDAGLISTNLHNAKRDLLEQLLQGATQEQQLQQLLTQIRQVDDYLNRLGKLEDVTDLPGLRSEAEAFLKELELNLPSFEIVRDIDPEELFGKTNGSPYEGIEKDILIDGTKVAEVNGAVAKPEIAARRAVDHYQHIRSEVLKKRSLLKGELDLSMQQIRNATTSAEVEKLTAVINGLNTQLSATDSDLQFAANELTARYYENKIEEDIQRKVEIQKDRAALKSGMRKHVNLFKLPSEPVIFQPKR